MLVYQSRVYLMIHGSEWGFPVTPRAARAPMKRLISRYRWVRPPERGSPTKVSTKNTAVRVILTHPLVAVHA